MEKRLAAFREAFQQIRVEERSPDAGFRLELKIFRDELTVNCIPFSRDERGLEYLLNSANAEADDAVALEDAIQAARQDIAADALKTLIQEVRRETQATEEKLLEEVKRAVRKEEQPHLAEVRKKREQVQQEKQRVEEELAAQALARQQETEMLELKKRFAIEYPEMKKYLIPLTTHGYRQFVGSSLHTVTKAGPLSYQGMIHAGVLNEGVPSVELFHCTIGSTNSNDRDLGAFPRWEGGRQDFENKFPRLLAIQKFVREFGPVMVKEEYLAP